MRSPAFQWYPKDILASARVAELSLEEEGAYRRALDFCWLNGDLPADPERLARVIGKGASTTLATVVASLFLPKEDDPTRLTHDRLEAERQKQANWREKSAEGGKRSAEVRQAKKLEAMKGGSTMVARVVAPPYQPNGNIASPVFPLKERGDGETPTPSEPDPDADASDTLSVQNAGVPTPTSDSDATPSSPLPASAEGVASLNGAARRPSRGSRIPDPFLLTASMREYAESRASGVDVLLETEKFVNHWRGIPGAKGVKLDWDATWRNWMLRAKEYEMNKTPVASQKTGIIW